MQREKEVIVFLLLFFLFAIPLFANPNSNICGVFDSLLATKKTLQVKDGSRLKLCNVDSYQANDSDIELSSLICSAQGCSENQECQRVDPTFETLDPTILKSSKSRDIPEDLNFTQNEYKDLQSTCDNLTFTFQATQRYEDGDTPFMKLGNFQIEGSHIVFSFYPGDYYFESLNFLGEDIKIELPQGGPVRIFSETDLIFATNDVSLNASGSSQDLFIYVGDEFKILSNSKGNGSTIHAYIYDKGNTTFDMKNGPIDISYQGALVSESDIRFYRANAQFSYDGEYTYGNCGNLFVGFASPEYQTVEDSILNVTIKLSKSADKTYRVKYATHDGTAIAGSDYTATSGCIKFLAGEQEKNISIYIKKDNLMELDENFTISLSKPSDGLKIGDYNPTVVTILEQTEPILCFEDNFDNSKLKKCWRSLSSCRKFSPKIYENRLRLTPREHNISTVITADYEFPAPYNLIKIEFDHYAWGGCKNCENMGDYGADGMALVLYDSSVGPNPEPGAHGGGLGYTQTDYHFPEAQENGEISQPGFQKGWLGIGFDEFGNYIRGNEGRIGGIWGDEIGYGECELVPNNVTIRGASGELTGETNCGRDCDAKEGEEARCCGYRYLTSSAQKPKDDNNITCTQTDKISQYMELEPPIADKQATRAEPGDHYVITIDSRDPAHIYIWVERNGQIIIDKFDAKAPQNEQPPIPDFIRLALTAETGRGCNNHEIDNLKVYGVCRPYIQENNATYLVTENESALNIINIDEWRSFSQDTNLTTKTAPVHKKYCVLAANPQDLFTPAPEDQNISIYYENSFGVHQLIVPEGIIPYSKAYCFDFTYNKAAKKGWFKIVNRQNPKIFNDSNQFAIKPDHFEIVSSFPLVHLHAGKQYNLTLKAVDSNGNPLPDYNQSSSNILATSTYYYADDTPCNGCNDLQGILSAFTNPFAFVNGITQQGSVNNVADFSFDNVGKISLKVIDTSWADIDNDDTPANCQGSWICGEINATFIPDHFQVHFNTLTNYSNGLFTYFSNSPLKMGAAIGATFQAMSSTNRVTTNFKAGSKYYENPVTIQIHIQNTPVGSLPIEHNISNTLIGFQNGSITIPWNETNQTKQLCFTFKRDSTLPLEPYECNDSTVNIKIRSFYGNEEINGSTTGVGNQKALFVYGRIHAPLYKTQQNSIQTKLFFEIYDPNSQAPISIKGAQSEDDIDWYRNTAHDSTAYGQLFQLLHNGHDLLTGGDSDLEATLGALNSGVRFLTLKYKKSSYPYSAKIDLNASRWLIYNRYDPNAITNTMEVIFEGKGNWKGIGTFKTQDEFNQSQVPYNRIQW